MRRVAAGVAWLCLAAVPAAALAEDKAGRKRAAKRPAQVQRSNTALLDAIARRAGEPRWAWIVTHHTAGERDSLKGISRYHARRFEDPLGIRYHFLIGNGHSAGDGEIQLARWPHRRRSIHVAHPERAPIAITVSIQGNLHTRKPSPGQMLAVERLVLRLMTLYEIPLHRISSNTRVDGTVSVCPGLYFPFDRLIWRLRQTDAPKPADWRHPLEPAPLDGTYADLETLRASLVWDVLCRERIPVGPWMPLGRMKSAEEGHEAQLLGIDGGRGCTPIQRRFLALRSGKGWYARELNGYRKARLRKGPQKRRGRGGAGVALLVDARDERGVMQRCVIPIDGAPTCRLPAPGES